METSQECESAITDHSIMHEKARIHKDAQKSVSVEALQRIKITITLFEATMNSAICHRQPKHQESLLNSLESVVYSVIYKNLLRVS